MIKKFNQNAASRKVKLTKVIAFIIILFLSVISTRSFSQGFKNGVWDADNGDGNYTNPIIHADYSDPDVIRVGEDFYMTASSFNCVPGLPVLHSNNLVTWEITGYAISKLPPYDVFDKPQHGNGVWAPAIRYHNGEFYIYWGDPDFGIYVVKAKNPEGPWSEPHLVQPAKGWIDPCPFWDEDGKAYLVHAFAGSRSGIKSILVINEMSPDGLSLNENCTLVFEGHENHNTIEGPKLYKRNGYYYIFAPAGGVKPGWQTILRSKNIYGPYEDKIVLHQGNTDINGPHQGGYIELESGESWFIHFQDKYEYGRIVHLQPVNWIDDWPMMGVDQNNDGIGEPVLEFQKPTVSGCTAPVQVPVSDEFDSPSVGLQWQWHANPEPEWAFASPYGFLRLNCVMTPEGSTSLWDIPNLFLQKLPTEEFTATTCFKFSPKEEGDRIGLVMMGEDYAYIASEFSEGKTLITFNSCTDARTGGKEIQTEKVEVAQTDLYFRIEVKKGGKCLFSYSTNGTEFYTVGEEFKARAGRWIGAKVGIFALKSTPTNDSGYADFDWFRAE